MLQSIADRSTSTRRSNIPRSNDRSIHGLRRNEQIVIFSDVDGTLLDNRYQLDVPLPVLRQAFDQFCVVLVSSRTLAELFHLQEEIGCDGPCIAENGGIIADYTPLSGQSAWSWEAIGPGLMAVHQVAAPIGETIQLVRQLAAQYSVSITGLADLSVSECALRSGYSTADAARAVERRASVLLDPEVAEQPGADALWSALQQHGCTILFGGRWISIVRGADKGRAARAYLRALASRGERVSYTVGIGNESNDEALLRVVDRPFVIRNPGHGYAKRLANIPGATLLQQAGGAGWVEAFEALT